MVENRGLATGDSRTEDNNLEIHEGFAASPSGQARGRSQPVLDINLPGISVRLAEVELMPRHWAKCCRAGEKFVGRDIELA